MSAEAFRLRNRGLSNDSGAQALSDFAKACMNNIWLIKGAA